MRDNKRELEPLGPLGARIRSLRLARGWSLAELAARAGTSAPALHRYESGWDKFSLSTLRKIAAALGASLEIRLIDSQPARPVPPFTRKDLVRLLSPLFWDRRLTAADLETCPRWVMARVLMFGNMDQVRAARKAFGDRVLTEALDQRGLDERTRSYWQAMLGR